MNFLQQARRKVGRMTNPRGFDPQPFIQLGGALTGAWFGYELLFNGLIKKDCRSIGGKLAQSISQMAKITYTCGSGTTTTTAGGTTTTTTSTGATGGGSSGSGGGGGSTGGGGLTGGSLLLVTGGSKLWSSSTTPPTSGVAKNYGQCGYFDASGSHVADGWLYTVYQMTDGSYNLIQVGQHC